MPKEILPSVSPVSSESDMSSSSEQMLSMLTNISVTEQGNGQAWNIFDKKKFLHLMDFYKIPQNSQYSS